MLQILLGAHRFLYGRALFFLSRRPPQKQKTTNKQAQITRQWWFSFWFSFEPTQNPPSPGASAEAGAALPACGGQKGFWGEDLWASGHTVDGRNPAPPKKQWNDAFPVNTNKQWCPMFQMQDFVHPQQVSLTCWMLLVSTISQKNTYVSWTGARSARKSCLLEMFAIKLEGSANFWTETI